MDKVLFSLKNGHKLESIPASFTEAELGLLYDLAEISNFTASELAEYEAAMMNRYDYKATIDYAEKKGREEERSYIMALLKQGLSAEDLLKRMEDGHEEQKHSKDFCFDAQV
jgi:hypothetical protein